VRRRVVFGVAMGTSMRIPSLKFSLLAGIALVSAGAANAADYFPPQPMQQPMIMQQPVEEFASNWYLRGHVGIGINSKTTVSMTPLPPDTFFATNSIADSVFLGAGVGYVWNSWLRFDVSAEYRAKTRITALTVTQPGGSGPVALDVNEANLSSFVFLANAFVDLGTWDCWTPFVGVGIGVANNKISDFVDTTPSVAAFGATGSSFGLGRGTTNWSLAWALYAGLSFAVTKNFNIDLTYRYLNFGSANDTVDCNGSSSCNHFEFKDLHSNDIMLGLRWTCCEVEERKVQQVYVPPPVYTPPPQPVYSPPPPIRSRG
jgi:opacity protein-like surface antigen